MDKRTLEHSPGQASFGQLASASRLWVGHHWPSYLCFLVAKKLWKLSFFSFLADDVDVSTKTALTKETRMEVMLSNARRIALMLQSHPKVKSCDFDPESSGNMIAFYIDGNKALVLLDNPDRWTWKFCWTHCSLFHVVWDFLVLFPHLQSSAAFAIDEQCLLKVAC